jgi:hypothetical protein
MHEDISTSIDGRESLPPLTDQTIASRTGPSSEGPKYYPSQEKGKYTCSAYDNSEEQGGNNPWKGRSEDENDEELIQNEEQTESANYQTNFCPSANQ